MQHGNAQPVEEEATAKGAEVARSELVLSGNRVKSLLDSLLERLGDAASAARLRAGARVGPGAAPGGRRTP